MWKMPVTQCTLEYIINWINRITVAVERRVDTRQSSQCRIKGTKVALSEWVSEGEKRRKKKKEKKKAKFYICYHMCFIPLLCIKATHKRIQATGKSIGVSNRRERRRERKVRVEKERKNPMDEGEEEKRKREKERRCSIFLLLPLLTE